MIIAGGVVTMMAAAHANQDSALYASCAADAFSERPTTAPGSGHAWLLSRQQLYQKAPSEVYVIRSHADDATNLGLCQSGSALLAGMLVKQDEAVNGDGGQSGLLSHLSSIAL